MYTDTQRLDWLMDHPEATFEPLLEGHYLLIVYLTSSEHQTQGVSGSFLARGDSKRAALDAMLSGNVRRIY